MLFVLHCSLQIQFDNRGTKVEGKADKLTAALAKLFNVPPKQVSFTGVIGQSSLFNHQVSYDTLLS